jgi:hypothetical protein
VELKGKEKKKKHPKDSVRYSLKQSLKKSLGQGTDLKEAVKCPQGEEENEWIAMNSISENWLIYFYSSI